LLSLFFWGAETGANGIQFFGANQRLAVLPKLLMLASHLGKIAERRLKKGFPCLRIVDADEHIQIERYIADVLLAFPSFSRVRHPYSFRQKELGTRNRRLVHY
jgi:hypothetical protein